MNAMTYFGCDHSLWPTQDAIPSQRYLESCTWFNNGSPHPGIRTVNVGQYERGDNTQNHFQVPPFDSNQGTLPTQHFFPVDHPSQVAMNHGNTQNQFQVPPFESNQGSLSRQHFLAVEHRSPITMKTQNTLRPYTGIILAAVLSMVQGTPIPGYEGNDGTCSHGGYDGDRNVIAKYQVGGDHSDEKVWRSLGAFAPNGGSPTGHRGG